MGWVGLGWCYGDDKVGLVSVFGDERRLCREACLVRIGGGF